MAAFFWVPAMVERSLVRFDSVAVSDPSQYFIALPQAMMLGIPTVLSLAFALGLRSKQRALDTVMIVLIVVGFVMAMPISAFLWTLPLLTKFVQFPYRFLIIPLVLGPWVVARTIEAFKGWKRMVLLIVFAGLWIVPVIAQEQSIAFVNRAIGYYTTNEGTTTVADEYMPRWVSEIPQQRPLDTLDVVSGNVNLSARRFPKETIDAMIYAKGGGVVQINKVYYPGWGVTIDGVLVPIDYQNTFGFMRITVPSGTHKLQAAFRETPGRFLMDIVSVVSVICYFVFIKRLDANT